MSSLSYDLTLAGLSVGAAAALTGIGLIVTYRATGVLNFAHGAVAMLCAYLLRQLVVVWELPLWAAAALVLLVVAPGFGLALERWVFRPLSLTGNDPARTLVASIGVFVLLVGAAALLWGTGAQEDAPTLIPGEPWGQLAVACAIGGTVWAVTRWTRFGGELRAVVDNRPLAVPEPPVPCPRRAGSPRGATACRPAPAASGRSTRAAERAPRGAGRGAP